jgi:hypothetical protein
MPYLSQFNLPPEVSVGNIALETVPNPEELFKGADQAFTNILDNVFGTTFVLVHRRVSGQSFAKALALLQEIRFDQCPPLSLSSWLQR